MDYDFKKLEGCNKFSKVERGVKNDTRHNPSSFFKDEFTKKKVVTSNLKFLTVIHQPLQERLPENFIILLCAFSCIL